METSYSYSEGNVTPLIENSLDLPIDFFSSLVERAEIGDVTSASPIMVGGPKEIGLNKLNPEDIEKYLYMHPVVPRGIEIKANRILAGGIDVVGGNEESRDYINEILNASGREIRIKRLIEDAYAFGDGYWTLVLNKTKDSVLFVSQQHPIYFRPAIYPKNYEDKNLAGKIKIDEKTKQPASYSEFVKKEGYDEFTPIGKEIPPDRVVHLVFDTWGDEVMGVSLIQYMHSVIKYMLNIEEAAAETLYRNGFNQKKVTTEYTRRKDLEEFAKNTGGMNSSDVLVLPKGVDVSNLVPGTTEFAETHNVFLTELAIRLGIPKPLLTLDGTATNKSTLAEQRKDLLADIQADARVIENTLYEQFIVPACKVRFGEDFKDFPRIRINIVAESATEKAERVERVGRGVQQLTESMLKLSEIGVLSDDIKENFRDKISGLVEGLN